MKILTLDSSGPVCAVALARDGRILYEARSNNGLTHSEALMPMIDQALRAASVSARALDLIGCVAGPGSFTGVRIGVCVARGLAHAWGIACARLNALEVLAMGAFGFEGTICPILDARRGQVYGAAFSFREGDLPGRLTEDAALALEEYLRLLPERGRLLFVGDGADTYAPMIRERMGERALIAPPHIAQISAAAGCALAERNAGVRTGYPGLTPIYLRLPQAERERRERTGGKEGEARA